MKASIVDLRYHTKEIIKSLDRGESVTLLYHGKEKGIITPTAEKKAALKKLVDHPAFGIWKGNPKTSSVNRFVADLRKGRNLDI